MKNTAGQEMDNNAPVYGCRGCDTTAGRSGCSIHSFFSTKEEPEKETGTIIIKSSIKAWRVYKSNYCKPDEHIGYFQTFVQAEKAKQDYIDGENKRCGRFLGSGICCNKIKDVLIEEIEIV